MSARSPQWVNRVGRATRPLFPVYLYQPAFGRMLVSCRYGPQGGIYCALRAEVHRRY
jgi:hypothetical protein